MTKTYMSTEILGMKGRSFSKIAAQTDVGLGGFNFDFDLVRPRLHSWPS